MTDTIGWGDVDVDEGPRRRRRRVPVWVAWPLLAVTVAGFALAPTEHHRLADHAAAWLQRQWATAVAYDSSRQDLESSVITRLATGDAPALAQLVVTLDREQATRVEALAKSVGRHRGWAKDVDTAAAAVRRTLVAEAADLRTDARAAPRTIVDLQYPPTPTTGRTQLLAEQTGDLLRKLAAAHHVSPSPHVSARLTSATAAVRALLRMTARPVDVRLGVEQNGEYDVWDLRTGTVRRTVSRVVNADGVGAVLPRVGSSLLASVEGGSALLTATGATTLPSPDGAYWQPAGDDGLWLTHGITVRRYDATGHPVGPPHRFPARTEVGTLAATSNALVIALNTPDAGAQSEVWHPDTGVTSRIKDACDAGLAGARRAIVYVSCDGTHLSILDTDTAALTTLRLPAAEPVAESGPMLSPDGRRVAVTVQPRGVDRFDHSRIAVYTVGHSKPLLLRTPGVPLTWSADGSVLLVDTSGNDDTSTTTFSPLAYWTDGMDGVAGIRINLTGGPYAVGLLP